MTGRGQEGCRQASVRGSGFGSGVGERNERDGERERKQERTPWMEGIIRPQGKITDGHLARERARESVCEYLCVGGRGRLNARTL